MEKVIIFGNSGSGKTTLATELSAKYGLAHLDLDTLAWENTSPPGRKPIAESLKSIQAFLDSNAGWVIEGCYADLLQLVINKASEVIFLNPGIDTCIENCRNRPWEPHKYKSSEEQDRNLDMLISWVKEYVTRTDEFSLIAHRALFDSFPGKKTEIT